MADPPPKPPQTAYYPDGRPIAPADLPQAIADGQANWLKGSTVKFVAPDGSGWEIKAEDAHKQLARGWRPVSDQEFAVERARRTGEGLTLKEGLIAGPGKFVEGLLPGGRLITDRFVTDEERALSEAKAPTLSALSEIAGMVAPMVVTGGTSGAARATLGGAAKAGVAEGAGALAARGLASRAGLGALGTVTAPARAVSAASTAVGRVAGLGNKTAGTVIASGLEGATYAAGNELARQARGDADFNAEAFLGAVGEGALFGGAAGLGAHTAGRVIAGGARRGANAYRALTNSIAKADNELVGKGAGHITEVQAAGARALGIPVHAIRGAKDGPAKLAVLVDEALESGIIAKDGPLAAAKESLFSKASKFNAAFEDLGAKKIPGVYSEVDTLMGKLPDMSPDAKLIDAAASSQAIARKSGLLTPLIERVASLRSRGGEYAKVAGRIESDWLTPLQKSRTLTDFHQIEKDLRREATSKGETVHGDELRLLRGDLKTAVRNLIAEVSPEHGTKLRKYDELYSAFKAYQKPISDAATTSQAKRADIFSPYEQSIIAGGAVLPVAGSFGVGAVIAGVRSAARHIQSSDRVAAYMARAMHSSHQVADAGRFTLSGAIKKAAQKVPLRITPGTPGRVAELARQFHERSEGPLKAVARPQQALLAMADAVEPIARVDPDQAQRIIKLRADDLKWLAERVPKGWEGDVPLDDLTRSAKQKGQRVAPSVAAKFVRESKALGDPIGEVEKIGEGKLPSPELAAVLLERRPKLREAIEMEFDQQVADLALKGQKMSYETRIQATMLTGKAYDSTVTPEAINFYQTRWTTQRAPTESASQGPAPAGGARKGRVTKETRKRVSRFQTTAEGVMDESEL